METTQNRATRKTSTFSSRPTPKIQHLFIKHLMKFGAPLSGLSAQDFQDQDSFFTMGNPPARVDILMGIPGVVFEEAWGRRAVADIEGLVVPFISKTDLIATKLAAGRPQDLVDVEHLQATNFLPNKNRFLVEVQDNSD